MAIFLYLAGAVVELIPRGVVGEYFGEGRRRRAIGQLRDHTIICGFGRSVAAEFEHAGSTFVATPGPDEVLGTGDVLIGVGSKDEIRRLEELFAPEGAGVA